MIYNFQPHVSMHVYSAKFGRHLAESSPRIVTQIWLKKLSSYSIVHFNTYSTVCFNVDSARFSSLIWFSKCSGVSRVYQLVRISLVEFYVSTRGVSFWWKSSRLTLIKVVHMRLKTGFVQSSLNGAPGIPSGPLKQITMAGLWQC